MTSYINCGRCTGWVSGHFPRCCSGVIGRVAIGSKYGSNGMVEYATWLKEAVSNESFSFGLLNIPLMVWRIQVDAIPACGECDLCSDAS